MDQKGIDRINELARKSQDCRSYTGGKKEREKASQ